MTGFNTFCSIFFELAGTSDRSDFLGLFDCLVFKDIDIFSFGKSSKDFWELISNLILGDKFN